MGHCNIYEFTVIQLYCSRQTTTTWPDETDLFPFPNQIYYPKKYEETFTYKRKRLAVTLQLFWHRCQ